MKVYYNGFNLHRQFPSTENIVKNFIDHVYKNLQEIEVSSHFVVLLVADIVVLQGAKSVTVPFETKISKICCNEDKVLVLLNDGDLYKVTESVIKVPKLINLEENDYISDISLGSKLSIAVTKSGFLYNIPNKMDFKKDTVQIKTGREHCLLLDQEGNVYSFGRGSRGQLGHGLLEDEAEPKLIEALGGIKIESIEAGGWHSCALSADGDLYVWGWNGNGQLGLSKREDTGEDVVAIMATPQVLDVEFNIKKVGCGSRHTVILSDKDELHGCGWNKYKQLRDSDMENIYSVTHIGNFSKVKSIKCSPWNTVLLCEE